MGVVLTVVISTMAMAQQQQGHTDDLAKACQSKNGKWLEKYSECENAERQWCATTGGRFDECASACRHNPDPTAPCTMQCVPLCIFPAREPQPDAKNPSSLDQAKGVLEGGVVAAANAKSGGPQDNGTAGQSPPPASPATETKAEPQKGESKEAKKESRGSIVVAPLPLVSPAIGSGIVPVAGYIFPFSKNDKVSPPSTVGAGGLITNNGTRGWGVGADLYLKENTYEITALYGKGNINYNLYGSGPFDGLKLPLIQSGSLFRGEVLRRLWWKIFVGPRFWTGQSFLTLAPNSIENLPPLPPGVGIHNHMRALGLRMIRDTRLNQFFPTAGEKLQFTADFFMQSLGSKYSFQSYKLTFNQYHSLSKNQVLAYDLFGCATSGQPPFYGNCIYGTSNELRGYVAGKYFDRYMFAAQVEYRLTLPYGIGLAGFTGVGGVVPGSTQLLFKNSHFLPDVGGGPRYELSKKYHVNLRADIAKGVDSWTWSVGIGEAF
ncbi:MAG TPA: BamA/TamA family outer membrane protein [Terriglobales bacterium]